MPEKPNWFVALPVSAGDWFPMASAPPKKVRLFHPEDLHLTIAFFGGVDEDVALRAWRSFQWPLPAMSVRLGEVVPMGPPRRPSALSATLMEGREVVAGALGQARDRLLEEAGLRPDSREPKPHVTLARPKRSVSDRERQEAISWARALDLGAPLLSLDRAALYTWSEDRASRLFRIVEECALPS